MLQRFAYVRPATLDAAIEHLASAVDQDPGYSAAWKLYGKALAAADRPEQAAQAYRQGIAVAEKNGDIQAAKEMRVFLKRIEKATKSDN